MAPSRRSFLTRIISLTAAGGTLLSLRQSAAAGESMAEEEADTVFSLRPVGRVEKDEKSARIRISEQYQDALLGLDGWSHVNVIYWFDKNDVPQKRRILQVHPRADPKNPLTGVFACRSPVRPNLLALTVCKIVSIEGNVINLDGIDAFDATPVLDLKPFSPADAPAGDVRVPQWAKKRE